MRSREHNTRQLTDQIFAAINETFQWRHVRNQRTQPLALRSITRKFARTSRLSNIVTIALGLGLPVAYGMGFSVISAYLINTGAPLLMSDFLTTLWFISLAALISFVAIVLSATFFFAPAFIFPTSLRLLKYTRTTTVNDFISGAARRSRLSVRDFGIQWYTVNGVPFAIILFLTLAYFTDLPATPLVWSISILWLLVNVAFAVFLICQYSMLFIRCSLLWRRVVLCSRVVLSSLWKMVWAASWAALLFQVMSKFVTLPILVLFVIYLYVIYFISSTLTEGIRHRVHGAIIFFAFLLIMFFPSYSGGKTLQVLHIGGGIPVSILRKTMVAGGKDVVAETIEACMVINAGSHIIIKRINQPTLDSCQTNLSRSVNPGERKMPTGIETIVGSDVISVTVL